MTLYLVDSVKQARRGWESEFSGAPAIATPGLAGAVAGAGGGLGGRGRAHPHRQGPRGHGRGERGSRSNIADRHCDVRLSPSFDAATGFRTPVRARVAHLAAGARACLCASVCPVRAGWVGSTAHKPHPESCMTQIGTGAPELSRACTHQARLLTSHRTERYTPKATTSSQISCPWKGLQPFTLLSVSDICQLAPTATIL